MMSLLSDLRFAWRSLIRARGLTLTVVATLALGIGANAAIFTVVKGVLLAPLANRDEDRLIYIRHSAPGLGIENAAFSMPEIRDFQARVRTITAFGDFSTINFTVVGLGEPRVVRAGVVSGSYFDVMGLRPVLGRLIDATDDGPAADGVIVLTHRFWTTTLGSEPDVVGKVVRLGDRAATIIGVLQPSVPYPAETEIVANIVTSPHHLDATMVDGRVHRMTELFGRLAPGSDVESAVAELRAVHGAIKQEYPESYPARSDFRVSAVKLRDQITAPARTVLLVLLAAAALVFVIACSNVANLILARSVRREGELAVRAALGASTGALRRTLLAESLLLCGAGALLGVLLARPMVAVLAQYAARFSVRALDLTVDASMLWVGAGLAILAAVVLAYVPRLPTSHAPGGLGLSSGSVRLTAGTNRRLRLFAVTQIAASFVLLAGAGMLTATLITLQSTPAGINTSQVLALHVPAAAGSRADAVAFYRQVMDRVSVLPGVERVAIGTAVPWREANVFGPGFQYTIDGYARADGEEDPRARFRTVSPGFFAALGVPIVAGRDFTDADRRDADPVVIVSQSVARRMFGTGEALDRHLRWTDPVMRFIDVSTAPRRIVGIAADLDDENVVPGPAMTIYHPLEQEIGGGRLFVHASGDPYALVAPITRIIRELAPDQPVERAATLDDVRAEVLTPDRLNALVFGGFAGVALTIAIVGVAGVLAFSVSARTREFGIRLAIGSEPKHLLQRVLGEGAVIAATGIVAGVAGGYLLTRLLGAWLEQVRLPGIVPIVAAAAILVIAACLASLMPAARAARVDVTQALRSE
jgi:putative ABC transport system permease protein